MRPSTPSLRRVFGVVVVLALIFGWSVGDFAASPVYIPDLPEADSVLVDKTARRLYLIKEGVPYRSYKASFGANPRGHKEQEGDQRTPEGHYLLDWRNPESRFYKSIHVSYPNEEDRRRAAALGVDPGGLIMIHGMPNWNVSGWADWFFEGRNWTNGCIAVKNAEMDEIWQAVRPDTPIEIRP